MAEQKFMHCVAAGSYSDYRVIAVCDTLKRAKAVAKAMNADTSGWHSDARAESFPYVDYDPVQEPHHTMIVNVWDDGTTSEEQTTTRLEWPFDPLYEHVPVRWRWVRAPWHENKGGRLEVMGTDLEQVRHVFGDRRAEALANDAFRLKGEAKGRG